VSHKVKDGDTLDSLALYYYNNPTYYWVIADFNRIQDPYLELEVGRILKIPTFSNIAFKL
jgi:nucleoid-associated protein YgaU